MADAPAYDHVIQAMTGFGANQADLKTGVPVLVQQAIVDKVTGLTAAQAITAALFERHRTGRGQSIEISMLHPGLAFLRPGVSTTATMLGDFSVDADSYNDTDTKLSKAMSTAWVRFAKTGDPNGPGLPSWPVFMAGKENYLEFGDRIAAGRALRKQQLDFLNDVGCRLRRRAVGA